MENLNNKSFSHLVAKQDPIAAARLQGSESFPKISGTVEFYPACQGSLVVAEVFGLPTAPPGETGKVHGPFYAFHLHEGNSCGSGAGPEPFHASGDHYNPAGRPHPYHAGDFPSILSDNGYGYISFYTDRITPEEAAGKTVIIHQHAEDFHSQPSGNAGAKIACGPVMLRGLPRK